MIQLDHLPDELLSLIVDNINNHGGLFNCALISKRFYAATIPVLWRAPKVDDGLSIDRLIRSLDASLLGSHQPMGLGHHIRQLNITAQDDEALDDHSLEVLIDHAQYLEDLTIHPAHRITDRSIQLLSLHCPQLRKLHLYNATITHRSVHYLGQRCRRLRELDLKACQHLLPITLLPFADHGALERLDLSECRWLTVEDTAVDLSALNQLKHLELVCTRTINAKFIEQLLPSPDIPLPLLTYFAITGSPDISDKVMVPFIVSHNRLESLHLLKCRITDSTLRAISTYLPTTLHVLGLFCCDLITAPAVRKLIKACPSLVMIGLEQCLLPVDAFPELEHVQDDRYIQTLGYHDIVAIRQNENTNNRLDERLDEDRDDRLEMGAAQNGLVAEQNVIHDGMEEIRELVLSLSGNGNYSI